MKIFPALIKNNESISFSSNLSDDSMELSPKLGKIELNGLGRKSKVAIENISKNV